MTADSPPLMWPLAEKSLTAGIWLATPSGRLARLMRASNRPTAQALLSSMSLTSAISSVLAVTLWAPCRSMARLTTAVSPTATTPVSRKATVMLLA